MASIESDIEHDAAELERLVRFMTRQGQRFGLALATYADATLGAEQRELAIRRASAANHEVATLALSDGEDILVRLARESHSHDVLFVIGLDEIAYDLGGTRPETLAMIHLNLRRDELPVLVDARVVFWISAEGYVELARLAWDLLQVMLARFEFRQEVVGTPTRPAWMVPDTGVDPRQLELQAEDLAKVAGTAKNGFTIADAAASAGRLYASMGRLDEAAHWLRVAADAYERFADHDPQPILAAVVQRRRLAEVARLRGRTDEALHEARRSDGLEASLVRQTPKS